MRRGKEYREVLVDLKRGQAKVLDGMTARQMNRLQCAKKHIQRRSRAGHGVINVRFMACRDPMTNKAVVVRLS